MKITNIKKSGKKYKIEFDNDSILTTYDDVILNNNLLYHKNIDRELLNKLNIDSNYYDIYYKTLNYITRKLRSEKEINEYLDKYEVEDSVKKEIINKLKSINFINDENFTKAFISDKIHLSNDGPYKIKKELLSHNISEDVIDKYLDIDENIIDDKINKLIFKKIKNSKYHGYYLKQKVVEYLINLGYSKDTIINIYDSFKIESDIKKEYDKLYKKLSTKYSDNELMIKIKQKLYQKGYTTDDINNMDI